MFTICSRSPRETYAIAQKLAKRLTGGEVIGLDGDLGAGKTVFVKGLAAGLGVCATVQSPTFTIVREYAKGRLPLYHFDVYRIADPDEMFEIGFEEYLHGGGVTVIEWASIIEELLPADALRIHIAYSGGDERQISFMAPNADWEEKLR